MLLDELREVTPSEDPSTLLAGSQTVSVQQLLSGQLSCPGPQRQRWGEQPAEESQNYRIAQVGKDL